MIGHSGTARQDAAVSPSPGRTRQSAARAAIAGIATLSLAAVALPALSHAAMPSKDTLYDTRTGPIGACPGVDWHVVVHPDRTMNGVVSWDDFKHMTRVSGTADKTGAFKTSSTAAANGQSPVITGTIEGKDLKASLSGTGSPCDNQTMTIPRVETSPSSG